MQRRSLSMERKFWIEDANCIGTPTKLFFGNDEKIHSAVDKKAAKKICSNCEVEVDCLIYALRTDEPYGIYGGMNLTERRRAMDKHNNDIPSVVKEHFSKGNHYGHKKT